MRKLTVSTILLAVVSTAGAGFHISVNGVVDPCDSDTWLAPSDTAVLGIVGDAGTQSPATLWLLVQGPGSIECGNIVYPDSDCSTCEDCEDLIIYDPPFLCPPPELVDMFPGLTDFVFLVLCDFTAPPAPLIGLLADDIIFHCEGDSDVTITLLNEDFSVVYDTQVIHQGVPPPPPQEPRTYHVDTAGGNDTNDGLSRQTAFATIRKGIDTAQDGDTVLVWPGLYSESINFSGKAITVKSAADAAAIEAPGADGVTFHAGEGPDSVLKNFVIRNSGTAISLKGQSSPTIANLTIVNNDLGIVAYENSDPDITNCIFANNANGDLLGCTARYSAVAQEPDDGPIEGLVSRWKFDEGTGSTAYDSAGDNHGTVHGAQWITGKVGGALSFDGLNDHVLVPDNDSLDMDGEVTAAAWVKLTGTPDRYVRIVAKGGERDYQAPYTLMLDDTGRYLGVTIGDGTDWNYHVYQGQALSPCQWHCVAMTYSTVQNIIKLYIDGDLVLSESESAPLINTSTPLGIGALKYRGLWQTFFLGVIDDVRIYNRALSDTEIQQLCPAPADGPIAHWKFDEGAGDTAYDTVGCNNGTIHGAQWITGKVGGALSFDGLDDRVTIPDNDSQQITTNQITLSAWIRLNGEMPKAQGRIICKQYDSKLSWGMEIFGDGYHGCSGGCAGSHLVFHDSDGLSLWRNCVSPRQLNLGQWYHVAATDEAGVVRIYINGQLDSSYDDGYGIPSNIEAPIEIGTVYGDRAHCFDGAIDDVRIYDKALSEWEIHRVYQYGQNPPVDPLFADPNAGDYHLKSEHGRYWHEHDVWVLDDATSPCIDAGDPADDCSAEPKSNGGRINIGAYGGTAFASRSEWWPAGDANRDGIVNMLDFAIVADSWLQGETNRPPEVQVVSPPEGAVIDYFTETILLEAEAADPDGSVVRVEFFLDEVKVGQDDDGSNGWTLVISRPPPDWYTLTAVATDNEDAEAVSPPIEFRVDARDQPPPKVRACFPADTPVWVDGALVRIADVSPGQKAGRINCADMTGALERIAGVQEHPGSFECRDILLENGNSISVVDAHCFLLADGGWAPAQDLRRGMKLRSVNGPLAIRKVVKRPAPFVGKVYNLKIENSDTYLVGKDGISVRDY
jgi:parallel beta-helix repeat protein